MSSRNSEPGLHQLYRRPMLAGRWWSISAEAWASIQHTTRLKTLEHIGRIMETADGHPAPRPCDYCRKRNYNDCRVYSEAARQRGNTRTGCARCIRAKTNTKCSAVSGDAGGSQVEQLLQRVSQLEHKMVEMETDR